MSLQQVLLAEGTTIENRYEVISLVGEGGLGALYKAREPSLNRIVALKFLTKLDDENKQRFLREAKLMAQLVHENIVEIYRLSQYKQVAFIAMEFIEGLDLKKLIQKKESLPWQEAANICIQVCRGLQLLHDHGIMHRDIKPNNILISGEEGNYRAKLADFGLAGYFEHNEDGLKLTQTGDLIGSPHYMSPEQCIGQKADQRSDIYSLGCVLYECVFGSPPFSDENPVAVLHKHVHKTPEGLTAGSTKTAKPWLSVIGKCLNKNPDDRYQTANDLAADLSSVLTGGAPQYAQEIPIRQKKFSYGWPAACLAAIVIAVFTWEECLLVATPIMLQQSGGEATGQLLNVSDQLDSAGKLSTSTRMDNQIKEYATLTQKTTLLAETIVRQAQRTANKGYKNQAAECVHELIDVLKRGSEKKEKLSSQEQQLLRTALPLLTHKRSPIHTVSLVFSLREKCSLETRLAMDEAMFPLAKAPQLGYFEKSTIYNDYARDLYVSGRTHEAERALKEAIETRDAYERSHDAEWAVTSDCSITALILRNLDLAESLARHAIAARPHPEGLSSAALLLVLQQKGKLDELKKSVEVMPQEDFIDTLWQCRSAYASNAFTPEIVEDAQHFAQDLTEFNLPTKKQQLIDNFFDGIKLKPTKV